MKMRGTDVRAALRSARWVLVVLVLVGAVGGLLLDLRLDRSPVSSTARLEVSDSSGAPANSDSAQTMNSYITNQMPTYAAIATSDNVLEPAATSTGTTVAALRQEVTATSAEDSTTLTLVVRAATPEAATAEADAVVKSLSGAITQLETPTGQPPRVVVATSTPPTTPAGRFVPPMGTLAAAGALAGALVVVLGALAWATTLPQRGWRRFSTWLFRRPTAAELARIPAADPHERRDDPEQALTRMAGQWLAKLRGRG
jgi:capsular polysaccharide biosynthesis protein